MATMAQANGNAANEPQVPGAGRIRPTPNQVASMQAGWLKGRAGLCSLSDIQMGSRTVAVAWAAMPSLRPVKPRRSVVVALMLTRLLPRPEMSASRAAMAW